MALRKNHSILWTKFISSVYISLENYCWIGQISTFRKLQVHLKRGTPKPNKAKKLTNSDQEELCQELLALNISKCEHCWNCY